MSSYFTLPSFARAKKNREDLEKTNPSDPVLKDEDEKFLERVTSQQEAPAGAKDAPITQISDDGKEKVLPTEDQSAAIETGDQVAVPETQPASSDTQEAETTTDTNDPASGAGTSSKTTEEVESTEEPPVDDPPEEAPDTSRPEFSRKKSKKDKGMGLPSQEDAEAATRGWNAQYAKESENGTEQPAEGGEKRTWASYLPSIPTKKADTSSPVDEKQAESMTEDAPARTWASYASQYLPSASQLPSMPSMPASWRKDSKPEPVYNEDGSINEEATKEKEEKEVSVLLDNLSLSSINNRVFSFSKESQHLYERFTLVLKDVINGAPTAYEDMDKLMKDAGPQLEKQFAQLPPFVQTLVKSLPTKLGTTLGPELMAAASEKPGADLQKRMEATNKGADASIQAQEATEEQTGQKKKRKIPGLKGLVSEQGAVASILRNIVNFLRVRFPFLMSTTNVVMSLAVFLLMFVFWYCHKRGKEGRLAKEAEASKEGSLDGSPDAGSVEVSSESEDDEVDESVAKDIAEAAPVASQEDSAEAVASQTEDSIAGSGNEEKEGALKQAQPSEVPLSDAGKGEKGAELEAEKSVGV